MTFDPTALLVSPGYPEQYPPNVNQSWFVAATFRHRITLRFTEVDIQPGNGSFCTNDQLIVSKCT